MKKAVLPEKVCPACNRPFQWRRKWARDWDSVRYCSDACRTGRRAATRAEDAANRVAKLPRSS